MNLRIAFAVMAIFVFISPGKPAAQSIPSADEAFRVINYYYHGKGLGVVLAESRICQDIHKHGAAKYDCKNEIIEFGPLKADGSPPDVIHRVELGQSVYVWMSFLVPLGVEKEIYLEFNHGGETKRTSGHLSIKGALRYRTWSKFTPEETGDWEVKIFVDNEIVPELIGTFDLIVE